jgi:hypothetical protein
MFAGELENLHAAVFTETAGSGKEEVSEERQDGQRRPALGRAF